MCTKTARNRPGLSCSVGDSPLALPVQQFCNSVRSPQGPLSQPSCSSQETKPVLSYCLVSIVLWTKTYKADHSDLLMAGTCFVMQGFWLRMFPQYMKLANMKKQLHYSKDASYKGIQTALYSLEKSTLPLDSWGLVTLLSLAIVYIYLYIIMHLRQFWCI